MHKRNIYTQHLITTASNTIERKITWSENIQYNFNRTLMIETSGLYDADITIMKSWNGVSLGIEILLFLNLFVSKKVYVIFTLICSAILVDW